VDYDAAIRSALSDPVVSLTVSGKHSVTLTSFEGNTMTIEERIAAMRAGRSAQAQSLPLERKIHVVQSKPDVAVEQAPAPMKAFDISTNAIAKIMDRSDLSDKGKIESVVAFLNAKDENYSLTERHFAEFEAYFSYEQSKRTQVSEQNIQRLMNELAATTQSTVKAILHDFNLVNTGAGKIKQLLMVMERARVDGKTVEVLTEAYRANEKLLKEIGELKQHLAPQLTQETVDSNKHEQMQAEKDASSSGGGSLLFGLFKKQARLDESLYYSEYNLRNLQKKIQKIEQDLSAKELHRNKQLEDGNLTILRSVDATEGGLTNQILETANDSLSLIKGMRQSIETLLAANARSRSACSEISKSLTTMTSGETILKGALEVVATEAHAHGESLGREVEKVTHERADAAGDAVQLTLLTVRRDKVSQSNQLALGFERVVQTKVVSFQMLASANVQAEARAQQFATLIDSQHEVLSNLQQQALPITASALEMGLQQAVALRDGMLAAGVRDATKKAQEIFGASLEGATEAQTRLGAENLDQMRAAIVALGHAQNIISRRTDKAIEHGLASLALVTEVTASAGAVRDAMSDFEKVDAVLASHNGDATSSPATPIAPAAPAEGGQVGSVPSGPEENRSAERS
jgi:hypothetical protein